MKVWMIKEGKEYRRYAYKPGKNDKDYGEIFSCRWAELTPETWSKHNWYVFDSMTRAEWYRDGMVNRIKEVNAGKHSVGPDLQIVEVDVKFNGCEEPELKDVVDKPAKPKTENPPISERLNKRREEDLKKWLDKALGMLTDISVVANFHNVPGIDSLSASAFNHLLAVKKTMFPSQDDGEN